MQVYTKPKIQKKVDSINRNVTKMDRDVKLITKNMNKVKLKNKTKKKIKNKKKNKKTSFNPSLKDSLYLRSLVTPEVPLQAKVPSMFGRATISLHRHITVPISTNSSGNCGFCFLPQYLTDSTLGYSGFYASGFNTGNTGVTAGTYTTTGINTQTYITIPVSYSVTAGSIQNWILVSASIQVRPATNLLNNSGFIYLGVASYIGLIESPTSSAAAVVDNFVGGIIPSTIENLRYNTVASINRGEIPRAIWLPTKPNDFDNTPINDSPVDLGNADALDVFVCSITGTSVGGTATATPFNVEIYLNYEIAPVPGSTLSGMEFPSPDNGLNPQTIVSLVRQDPRRITQIIR